MYGHECFVNDICTEMAYHRSFERENVKARLLSSDIEWYRMNFGRFTEIIVIEEISHAMQLLAAVCDKEKASRKLNAARATM